MLFNARQQALVQRQTELRQRSAALRQQLTQDSTVLQAPLSWADQGLAALRWLQAHPQWVLVGTAALVVWRPRRALRLASRAWAGWRLWRQVQRWRAVAGASPSSR